MVEKKKTKKTENKSSDKKKTKASEKKVTLKKTKPKSQDNIKISKNMLYGLGIVALALIIIAVLLTNVFSPGASLAEVNGEKITLQDLETRKELLGNLGYSVNSDAEVLDELIREQLLIEEAARRGYTISQSELDERLNEFLMFNGLTQEQFMADLAEYGVTYSDFVEFFAINLLISEFLEREIENTNVSEAEIRTFYDQNNELFVTDSQVVVRHILVDDESQSDIVINLLNADNSNFCELVTEYSTDTASVEECGQYQFSRNDPFIEEFITAGFDMSIGEVRAVESQFGVHIIIKDDELPETLLSFSDVEEDIEDYLKELSIAEYFENLIDTLTSDANIRRY